MHRLGVVGASLGHLGHSHSFLGQGQGLRLNQDSFFLSFLAPDGPPEPA